MEQKRNINLLKPLRVVAVTTACAAIGVLGAIGAVTIAAAAEVVLPAALCLKAAGIAGGAVGLFLGLSSEKSSHQK